MWFVGNSPVTFTADICDERSRGCVVQYTEGEREAACEQDRKCAGSVYEDLGWQALMLRL